MPTKDEQARSRLVECAIDEAAEWPLYTTMERADEMFAVRARAGFKNPRTGSWCAAGLTAAMEDAGLVVPAPGTPSRRGAVALLDWTVAHNRHAGGGLYVAGGALLQWAKPGDIIAWLQYPPGKDPAGWRRGHVALIVAVDDESITTVGWNEGAAPGRVMKRRLWRHTSRKCPNCEGIDPASCPITECKGGWIIHKRSATVLGRKPNGMLYGIARPVAR